MTEPDADTAKIASDGREEQAIDRLVFFTDAVIAIVITMWAYACGRKLTAGDLPAHERRSGIVAPLATAAVFLGSIPIAFWNATAARFSWIAVLVIAIVLRFPFSR